MRKRNERQHELNEMNIKEKVLPVNRFQNALLRQVVMSTGRQGFWFLLEPQNLGERRIYMDVLRIKARLMIYDNEKSPDWM